MPVRASDDASQSSDRPAGKCVTRSKGYMLPVGGMMANPKGIAIRRQILHRRHQRLRAIRKDGVAPVPVRARGLRAVAIEQIANEDGREVRLNGRVQRLEARAQVGITNFDDGQTRSSKAIRLRH